MSGCWELNPVSLRPERNVIPIHYTPASKLTPLFAKCFRFLLSVSLFFLSNLLKQIWEEQQTENSKVFAEAKTKRKCLVCDEVPPAGIELASLP